MLVRYIGRSDVRTITSTDLQKAGVEATVADIRFPRRSSVEVPDEVGQALTSHMIFSGQFVAQLQPVEAPATEQSLSPEGVTLPAPADAEQLVDDTPPAEVETGKKAKSS